MRRQERSRILVDRLSQYNRDTVNCEDVTGHDQKSETD